ncbi:hypothetical protein NBRC111894_1302 [Sporolactobacillus inulinus]|uniref:Uncharacterized protein n=1 Tax=Sporolactobacillus inulinus TaxID=2078 RepID=A0A4Y1ZAG7_9BACL|nr:hypothetical protein NBRC111894_1302 [Sporolactobacillus inulinus]
MRKSLKQRRNKPFHKQARKKVGLVPIFFYFNVLFLKQYV